MTAFTVVKPYVAFILRFGAFIVTARDALSISRDSCYCDPGSPSNLVSKPYSDEEIGAALFQIGATKVPGPNGFPTLLYQTHWSFFKE